MPSLTQLESVKQQIQAQNLSQGTGSTSSISLGDFNAYSDNNYSDTLSLGDTTWLSAEARLKIKSALQTTTPPGFTEKDKEMLNLYLDLGPEYIQSFEKPKLVQFLSLIQNPEVGGIYGLNIAECEQCHILANTYELEINPFESLESEFQKADQISNQYSETEIKFRRQQYLVDPDAPEITTLLQSLYDQNILTSQQTTEEMAEILLNYVQTHFEYKEDIGKDHWNSVSETIAAGGGDCEDTAILLGSLLMAGLRRHGYSEDEIRGMVELSAGYLSDAKGNKVGHMFVKFMPSGTTQDVQVLDATDDAPVMQLSQLRYQEIMSFNDRTFETYGPIDSHFETAVKVKDGDALLDQLVDIYNLLKALTGDATMDNTPVTKGDPPEVIPGVTISNYVPSTENFSIGFWNDLFKNTSSDLTPFSFEKIGTTEGDTTYGFFWNTHKETFELNDDNMPVDQGGHEDQVNMHVETLEDGTIIIHVGDQTIVIAPDSIILTKGDFDVLTDPSIAGADFPFDNEEIINNLQLEGFIDGKGKLDKVAFLNAIGKKLDDTGRLVDDADHQPPTFELPHLQAGNPEFSDAEREQAYNGIINIISAKIVNNINAEAPSNISIPGEADIQDPKYSDPSVPVSNDSRTGFSSISSSNLSGTDVQGTTIEVYSATLNSDNLYRYITLVRRTVNHFATLYMLTSSLYEYFSDEATSLYDQALTFDEQQSQSELRKDDQDISKGVIDQVTKFQERLASSVQEISDTATQYVTSSNQAQMAQANFEADLFGNGPSEAVGVAITDYFTGAFSYVRAAAKYKISQTFGAVQAMNMYHFGRIASQTLVGQQQGIKVGNEVQFISDTDAQGRRIDSGISLWRPDAYLEQDQITSTQNENKASYFGQDIYDVIQESPDHATTRLANGMPTGGNFKEYIRVAFDKFTQDASAVLKEFEQGVDFRLTNSIYDMSNHLGVISSDKGARPVSFLEQAVSGTNNNLGNGNASAAGAPFLDIRLEDLQEIQLLMGAFTNIVTQSYMLRLALWEEKKEVAEQIGSSRTTEAGRKLKSMSQNLLATEINKVQSAYSQLSSQASTLFSVVNQHVSDRINIHRAFQQVVGKYAKLSGYITVFGLTAGLTPFLTTFTGITNPNYWTVALNGIGTAAIDSIYKTYEQGVLEQVLLPEWQVPKLMYTDFENNLYNRQKTESFIKDNIQLSNSANRDFVAGIGTTFNPFSDGETQYLTGQFNTWLRMGSQQVNRVSEKKIDTGSTVSDVVTARNMPDFLRTRSDGYLVTDGEALANSVFRIQEVQNKIRLVLAFLSAKYDAVEEVYVSMFGGGKKQPYAGFSSQYETVLSGESEAVSKIRTEMMNYQQAWNTNAGKWQKIASADYQMGIIPVDLANSSLEFIFEESSRFYSVLGASTATDFANYAYRVFGPYGGIYANYKGFGKGGRPTDEGNANTINGYLSTYEGNIRNNDASLSDYPITTDMLARQHSNLNFSLNSELDSDAYYQQSVTVGINSLTAEGRGDEIGTMSQDGLAQYGQKLGVWHLLDNKEDDIYHKFQLNSTQVATGNTGLTLLKTNFDALNDMQKLLRNLSTTRTMLAMIQNALFKAKNNELQKAFGNSTSAGVIDKMIQVMDQYNAAQDSLMNDLVTESNSRTEAQNSYTQSAIEAITSSTTIPIGAYAYVGLSRIPITSSTTSSGILARAARENAQSFSSSVKGISEAMVSAAVAGGLLVTLLNNDARGVNADTISSQEDSTVQNDQLLRDKKKKLEEKKKEAEEKGESLSEEDQQALDQVTAALDQQGLGADSELGGAAAQVHTSRGSFAVNKGLQQAQMARLTQVNRKLKLLKEVSLALENAKLDTLGKFVGDQNLGVIGGVLSVFRRFESTDKGLANNAFAAAQQVADLRNQQMDTIRSKITTLFTSAAAMGLTAVFATKKIKADVAKAPVPKFDIVSAISKGFANVVLALGIEGIITAASNSQFAGSRQTGLASTDSEQGAEGGFFEDGGDANGDFGGLATASLENATLVSNIQAGNLKVLQLDLQKDVEFLKKLGEYIAVGLKAIVTTKLLEQYNKKVENASEKKKEEKLRQEVQAEGTEDKILAAIERIKEREKQKEEASKTKPEGDTRVSGTTAGSGSGAGTDSQSGQKSGHTLVSGEVNDIEINLDDLEKELVDYAENNAAAGSGKSNRKEAQKEFSDFKEALKSFGGNINSTADIQKASKIAAEKNTPPEVSLAAKVGIGVLALAFAPVSLVAAISVGVIGTLAARALGNRGVKNLETQINEGLKNGQTINDIQKSLQARGGITGRLASGAEFEAYKRMHLAKDASGNPIRTLTASEKRRIFLKTSVELSSANQELQAASRTDSASFGVRRAEGSDRILFLDTAEQAKERQRELEGSDAFKRLSKEDQQATTRSIGLVQTIASASFRRTATDAQIASFLHNTEIQDAVGNSSGKDTPSFSEADVTTIQKTLGSGVLSSYRDAHGRFKDGFFKQDAQDKLKAELTKKFGGDDKKAQQALDTLAILSGSNRGAALAARIFENQLGVIRTLDEKQLVSERGKTGPLGRQETALSELATHLESTQKQIKEIYKKDSHDAIKNPSELAVAFNKAGVAHQVREDEDISGLTPVRLTLDEGGEKTTVVAFIPNSLKLGINDKGTISNAVLLKGIQAQAAQFKGKTDTEDTTSEPGASGALSTETTLKVEPSADGSIGDPLSLLIKRDAFIAERDATLSEGGISLFSTLFRAKSATTPALGDLLLKNIQNQKLREFLSNKGNTEAERARKQELADELTAGGGIKLKERENIDKLLDRLKAQQEEAAKRKDLSEEEKSKLKELNARRISQYATFIQKLSASTESTRERIIQYSKDPRALGITGEFTSTTKDLNTVQLATRNIGYRYRQVRNFLGRRFVNAGFFFTSGSAKDLHEEANLRFFGRDFRQELKDNVAYLKRAKTSSGEDGRDARINAGAVRDAQAKTDAADIKRGAQLYGTSDSSSHYSGRGLIKRVAHDIFSDTEQIRSETGSSDIAIDETAKRILSTFEGLSGASDSTRALFLHELYHDAKTRDRKDTLRPTFGRVFGAKRYENQKTLDTVLKKTIELAKETGNRELIQQLGSGLVTAGTSANTTLMLKKDGQKRVANFQNFIARLDDPTRTLLFSGTTSSQRDAFDHARTALDQKRLTASSYREDLGLSYSEDTLEDELTRFSDTYKAESSFRFSGPLTEGVSSLRAFNESGATSKLLTTTSKGRSFDTEKGALAALREEETPLLDLLQTASEADATIFFSRLANAGAEGLELIKRFGELTVGRGKETAKHIQELFLNQTIEVSNAFNEGRKNAIDATLILPGDEGVISPTLAGPSTGIDPVTRENAEKDLSNLLDQIQLLEPENVAQLLEAHPELIQKLSETLATAISLDLRNSGSAISVTLDKLRNSPKLKHKLAAGISEKIEEVAEVQKTVRGEIKVLDRLRQLRDKITKDSVAKDFVSKILDYPYRMLGSFNTTQFFLTPREARPEALKRLIEAPTSDPLSIGKFIQEIARINPKEAAVAISELTHIAPALGTNAMEAIVSQPLEELDRNHLQALNSFYTEISAEMDISGLPAATTLLMQNYAEAGANITGRRLDQPEFAPDIPKGTPFAQRFGTAAAKSFELKSRAGLPTGAELTELLDPLRERIARESAYAPVLSMPHVETETVIPGTTIQHPKTIAEFLDKAETHGASLDWQRFLDEVDYQNQKGTLSPDLYAGLKQVGTMAKLSTTTDTVLREDLLQSMSMAVLFSASDDTLSGLILGGVPELGIPKHIATKLDGMYPETEFVSHLSESLKTATPKEKLSVIARLNRWADSVQTQLDREKALPEGDKAPSKDEAAFQEAKASLLEHALGIGQEKTLELFAAIDIDTPHTDKPLREQYQSVLNTLVKSNLERLGTLTDTDQADKTTRELTRTLITAQTKGFTLPLPGNPPLIPTEMKSSLSKLGGLVKLDSDNEWEKDFVQYLMSNAPEVLLKITLDDSGANAVTTRIQTFREDRIQKFEKAKGIAEALTAGLPTDLLGTPEVGMLESKLFEAIKTDLIRRTHASSVDESLSAQQIALETAATDLFRTETDPDGNLTFPELNTVIAGLDIPEALRDLLVGQTFETVPANSSIASDPSPLAYSDGTTDHSHEEVLLAALENTGIDLSEPSVRTARTMFSAARQSVIKHAIENGFSVMSPDKPLDAEAQTKVHDLSQLLLQTSKLPEDHPLREIVTVELNAFKAIHPTAYGNMMSLVAGQITPTVISPTPGRYDGSTTVTPGIEAPIDEAGPSLPTPRTPLQEDLSGIFGFLTGADGGSVIDGSLGILSDQPYLFAALTKENPTATDLKNMTDAFKSVFGPDSDKDTQLAVLSALGPNTTGFISRLTSATDESFSIELETMKEILRTESSNPAFSPAMATSLQTMIQKLDQRQHSGFDKIRQLSEQTQQNALQNKSYLPEMRGIYAVLKSQEALLSEIGVKDSELEAIRNANPSNGAQLFKIYATLHKLEEKMATHKSVTRKDVDAVKMARAAVSGTLIHDILLGKINASSHQSETQVLLRDIGNMGTGNPVAKLLKPLLKDPEVATRFEELVEMAGDTDLEENLTIEFIVGASIFDTHNISQMTEVATLALRSPSIAKKLIDRLPSDEVKASVLNRMAGFDNVGEPIPGAQKNIEFVLSTIGLMPNAPQLLPLMSFIPDGTHPGSISLEYMYAQISSTPTGDQAAREFISDVLSDTGTITLTQITGQMDGVREKAADLLNTDELSLQHILDTELLGLPPEESSILLLQAMAQSPQGQAQLPSLFVQALSPTTPGEPGTHHELIRQFMQQPANRAAFFNALSASDADTKSAFLKALTQDHTELSSTDISRWIGSDHTGTMERVISEIPFEEASGRLKSIKIERDPESILNIRTTADLGIVLSEAIATGRMKALDPYLRGKSLSTQVQNLMQDAIKNPETSPLMRSLLGAEALSPTSSLFQMNGHTFDASGLIRTMNTFASTPSQLTTLLTHVVDHFESEGTIDTAMPSFMKQILGNPEFIKDQPERTAILNRVMTDLAHHVESNPTLKAAFLDGLEALVSSKGTPIVGSDLLQLSIPSEIDGTVSTLDHQLETLEQVAREMATIDGLEFTSTGHLELLGEARQGEIASFLDALGLSTPIKTAIAEMMKTDHKPLPELRFEIEKYLTANQDALPADQTVGRLMGQFNGFILKPVVDFLEDRPITDSTRASIIYLTGNGAPITPSGLRAFESAKTAHFPTEITRLVKDTIHVLSDIDVRNETAVSNALAKTKLTSAESALIRHRLKDGLSVDESTLLGILNPPTYKSNTDRLMTALSPYLDASGFPDRSLFMQGEDGHIQFNEAAYLDMTDALEQMGLNDAAIKTIGEHILNVGTELYSASPSSPWIEMKGNIPKDVHEIATRIRFQAHHDLSTLSPMDLLEGITVLGHLPAQLSETSSVLADGLSQPEFTSALQDLRSSHPGLMQSLIRSDAFQTALGSLTADQKDALGDLGLSPTTSTSIMASEIQSKQLTQADLDSLSLTTDARAALDDIMETIPSADGSNRYQYKTSILTPDRIGQPLNTRDVLEAILPAALAPYKSALARITGPLLQAQITSLEVSSKGNSSDLSQLSQNFLLSNPRTSSRVHFAKGWDDLSDPTFKFKHSVESTLKDVRNGTKTTFHLDSLVEEAQSDSNKQAVILESIKSMLLSGSLGMDTLFSKTPNPLLTALLTQKEGSESTALDKLLDTSGRPGLSETSQNIRTLIKTELTETASKEAHMYEFPSVFGKLAHVLSPDDLSGIMSKIEDTLRATHNRTTVKKFIREVLNLPNATLSADQKADLLFALSEANDGRSAGTVTDAFNLKTSLYTGRRLDSDWFSGIRNSTGWLFTSRASINAGTEVQLTLLARTLQKNPDALSNRKGREYKALNQLFRNTITGHAWSISPKSITPENATKWIEVMDNLLERTGDSKDVKNALFTMMNTAIPGWNAGSGYGLGGVSYDTLMTTLYTVDTANPNAELYKTMALRLSQNQGSSAHGSFRGAPMDNTWLVGQLESHISNAIDEVNSRTPLPTDIDTQRSKAVQDAAKEMFERIAKDAPILLTEVREHDRPVLSRNFGLTEDLKVLGQRVAKAESSRRQGTLGRVIWGIRGKTNPSEKVPTELVAVQKELQTAHLEVVKASIKFDPSALLPKGISGSKKESILGVLSPAYLTSDGIPRGSKSEVESTLRAYASQTGVSDSEIIQITNNWETRMKQVSGFKNMIQALIQEGQGEELAAHLSTFEGGHRTLALEALAEKLHASQSHVASGGSTPLLSAVGEHREVRNALIQLLGNGATESPETVGTLLHIYENSPKVFRSLLDVPELSTEMKEALGVSPDTIRQTETYILGRVGTGKGSAAEAGDALFEQFYTMQHSTSTKTPNPAIYLAAVRGLEKQGRIPQGTFEHFADQLKANPQVLASKQDGSSAAQMQAIFTGISNSGVALDIDFTSGLAHFSDLSVDTSDRYHFLTGDVHDTNRIQTAQLLFFKPDGSFNASAFHTFMQSTLSQTTTSPERSGSDQALFIEKLANQVQVEVALYQAATATRTEDQITAMDRLRTLATTPGILSDDTGVSSLIQERLSNSLFAKPALRAVNRLLGGITPVSIETAGYTVLEPRRETSSDPMASPSRLAPGVRDLQDVVSQFRAGDDSLESLKGALVGLLQLLDPSALLDPTPLPSAPRESDELSPLARRDLFRAGVGISSAIPRENRHVIPGADASSSVRPSAPLEMGTDDSSSISSSDSLPSAPPAPRTESGPTFSRPTFTAGQTMEVVRAAYNAIWTTPSWETDPTGTLTAITDGINASRAAIQARATGLDIPSDTRRGTEIMQLDGTRQEASIGEAAADGNCFFYSLFGSREERGIDADRRAYIGRSEEATTTRRQFFSDLTGLLRARQTGALTETSHPREFAMLRELDAIARHNGADSTQAYTTRMGTSGESISPSEAVMFGILYGLDIHISAQDTGDADALGNLRTVLTGEAFGEVEATGDDVRIMRALLEETDFPRVDIAYTVLERDGLLSAGHFNRIVSMAPVATGGATS